MANTEAGAPLVEAQDPFNGQAPTLGEYMRYRNEGEVPARFQPADNADTATATQPSDTASEGPRPESEGDTESPENTQEHPAAKKPHQTAQQRIAQLNATIEKLWEQEDPDTIRIAQLTATIDKIEQSAGIKRRTAIAPVAQPNAEKPEPTAAAATNARPRLEDKKDDGTPKYASYEDFVEDLGRWSAQQTLEADRQARERAEQGRHVAETVEEARKRYGSEFETIIEPTAAAIMASKEIPAEVKRMVSGSDVLAELVYTLGTDDETMQRLVRAAQRSPHQALRYIATVEAAIRQEIESESAAQAPATPKTTAPKPPVPVGGGGARSFDVSDESLSAEEWARQRNAQLMRRKKA